MSDYWDNMPELPTLEMQILYGPDENGIVVLNKPAGMDTFNTNHHKSGYPQMCDVLREYWPEGGPPHRIDRGTSGVHVWAANKLGLSIINTTTGWKEAHKTYLAVAGSIPKWDYCEVTMDVKNDAAKIDVWKPCTTGLTRLNKSRLVACELLVNGRTHQIRKAMQAVGFPLDGDVLYGGNDEGGVPVPYSNKWRPRFMLHAWRWAFRGISVQGQLPPDMAQWEPGGYTEPLWSFPVPPLTKEQFDRLENFRMNNTRGRLVWPELTEVVLGERGAASLKREEKRRELEEGLAQ